MRDNRRFERGTSVFNCSRCGKRTRNTTDSVGMTLCQACYDLCGLENAHADGTHDAKPCPECPLCQAGPRTIDITPTWTGLLPALLVLLENGTAEGRTEARAELRRMAQAADKAVAVTEALGYYVKLHERHRLAMPEGNENEGKEWARTLDIARKAME